MLFNSEKKRKIILVDDDSVCHQICKMVLRRTLPYVEFKVFDNSLDALEWINDYEDK